MGKMLDAIDAAILQNEDKEFRSHLGASSIGDPCARKLWYSFRWATRQSHKPQLLRLFERGKLEEARFVTWLENAGITVHQNDSATGKQYRFLGYKGHFAGEMDGVGVGVLTKPYILEFKTHNEKSFKDVAANGVLISKEVHYIQMQIYMGKFGLSQAVYLAICKNNDEIYEEVVKFNQMVYERYCKRAEMIIDAPEPPPRISTNASWFECKWCEHHAVCHTKAAPEKNCRTCAHSTPIEHGRWECENLDSQNGALTSVIPIAVMRNGCPSYYQHPME
jgi:hypothetical protein